MLRLSEILYSAAFTFAAYTDTDIGFHLRCFMVEPLNWIDPYLAAYVALFWHF